MRRTQQVIRNAIGPMASRLSNQNYPFGDADSFSGHGAARQDRISEHDEALPEASFTNTDPNNIMFPQSPIAPPIEPAPLHDVGAIQMRVGSALDALQTSDHMTAAELSLIKTVRETASDTEILNKIVNNNSFQEFINLHVPSVLFEQRPQITENGSSSSSSASPRRPILSEYDSEDEFEAAYNRRSSASSGSSVPSSNSSYAGYSSSSSYMSDYETDEETNFLHGRARRVHNIVDTDPNNIVQQRALNRLNELCHQISPEISGWRTEGPPSIVETEPEPVISRPTMEGPGMPGVPTPTPSPPPPAKEQSQSQWTNPVYLFVITACVIPITILAVTAVVYPSPRTWSLLKTGVKAVCSKLGR